MTRDEAIKLQNKEAGSHVWEALMLCELDKFGDPQIIDHLVKAVVELEYVTPDGRTKCPCGETVLHADKPGAKFCSHCEVIICDNCSSDHGGYCSDGCLESDRKAYAVAMIGR